MKKLSEEKMQNIRGGVYMPGDIPWWLRLLDHIFRKRNTPIIY